MASTKKMSSADHVPALAVAFATLGDKIIEGGPQHKDLRAPILYVTGPLLLYFPGKEPPHKKCLGWDPNWRIFGVHSHRKVVHIILSQNTLCKRLFIHIRELLAQPNTICMCKRANLNMYRVVFLIRNFCFPPLVPDDLLIKNLDTQPPLLLLGMCRGDQTLANKGVPRHFWPENNEPPL